MDPDPLRLLETAPPLRSSTLSANPANSRFSVREDRRLASSEAVNKILQKTLTDQLRSLVLDCGVGVTTFMRVSPPFPEAPCGVWTAPNHCHCTKKLERRAILGSWNALQSRTRTTTRTRTIVLGLATVTTDVQMKRR